MCIISGPIQYRVWCQVDDIGVLFGNIMDVFDSRHQISRRLCRLTLAGVLGGCYRFHCRFMNVDRAIPVVKSSQGVNRNGWGDIVGWHPCFMLVVSEYDGIPSMGVMDIRLFKLSPIPCWRPSISLR